VQTARCAPAAPPRAHYRWQETFSQLPDSGHAATSCLVEGMVRCGPAVLCAHAVHKTPRAGLVGLDGGVHVASHQSACRDFSLVPRTKDVPHASRQGCFLLDCPISGPSGEAALKQDTGAPGLVDDVVAGAGGGHEQLLIEQLIRQPHKGARPVRLLPLPCHAQHLRWEETIMINKERLESSDQGAAAQRRPPGAPAPAAAPRPAPARKSLDIRRRA